MTQMLVDLYDRFVWLMSLQTTGVCLLILCINMTQFTSYLVLIILYFSQHIY